MLVKENVIQQIIEEEAFGAIASKCAFLTVPVESSGQAPRSCASFLVSASAISLMCAKALMLNPLAIADSKGIPRLCRYA